MMLVVLALVFAVGFAAHRASLCNVRAVAEILERKPPRLLASFFQAAAWMALVNGVLLLAMQGMLHPALQRAPLALAMGGAAVFGIGAAINGGCSLSTLQRLADGELAMVGTLAGFALGLLAWTRWVEPALPMAGSRELAFALASGMPWKPVVLLALAAWASRELWRLARNGKGGPLARLRATPWAPASAAVVLGLAGGLLYTLQGSWTWTGTLAREIEAWSGLGMPPGPWPLLILSALVAGMALSSWQRGAFALRPRLATRAVVGGAMMGLGAGALPGGNDAVVLVMLPTLAPEAFAVYGAMLAGIAATLLALRPRRTA